LRVRHPIVNLRTPENLQIGARKMVVWIIFLLAFKLRPWLHLHHDALCIRIRFIARETVDLGVLRFQPSQHVVKGAVFHHQNDDMFELI